MGIGFLQCRAHGGGHALHSGFVKLQITNVALQFAPFEDALRFQISHGRFVLVNGAHKHAITAGVGCLGQGLAPTIKGGITNLTPVHRHKNHRLAPSK